MLNNPSNIVRIMMRSFMLFVFACLASFAGTQARAADEIAGSFTQSATYDCRTDTVVYEIRMHIPPDVQSGIEAAESANLVFEIISDLPAGLKWDSVSMDGDMYHVPGSARIVSHTRDSDRIIAEPIYLHPADSNGDGIIGNVVIRAVAKVQPGMPLPHTFSSTAILNATLTSVMGDAPYAEGLESVPPGGGLGTITKTGTPTEVAVDPALCAPDPADPGRPDRGEACLSAQAAVYCGEEDGEYTVIVTGETESPDFVVIRVLTPGVTIDVMGSPEVEVAVPVVAGTYYTELAIVGAVPGSAITLAIEGDGDIGVVEDLPDGFALCCATELIVVIPPECEDRPEKQPDPEPEWDLKLEKTFNGGQACNAGEACDFKIRVTNEGPSPHVGDVVVRDSAEGKPYVFGALIAPAPWGCVGDEKELQCTYPDADLAVGSFVELPIRVIPLLAKIGEVQVENCAEIIQEADSKDGNAVNDKDCAESPAAAPDDKVPPPPPPPPPPPVDDKIDLSITKTAPASCQGGGDCTFTITVRNEARSTYNGDLVVSDVPGSAGASYKGHSPNSWTCVRAARGVVCNRPGTTLAPGQSVSLAITFSVPDTTAVRRSGFENCGYLGGESAGAIGGGDVRSVQQALKDFGYNPGPIDGVFGRRTADALRGFQRANDLAVTGTITAETIDRLGLGGDDSLVAPWVDDFADDNAFCVSTRVTAPPPPPPPVCGAGQTLRNGKCVSICRSNQEYRNGRCRDRVVTCPSGQEFRNGRCRPIRVVCPQGTELRNGRCRPIRVQCPTGQEFRNGRCRPVRIECPTGQRLVNGRCVPILIFCQPGEVLVNGKCQRLQIQCPRGQEFRNGRCRPIRSQTGPSEINPQQTTPTRCKRGETLVNGRCVRLQIQIPNLGTIQIQ